MDNSSSDDGSGDWDLDFVDGMDLEGWETESILCWCLAYFVYIACTEHVVVSGERGSNVAYLYNQLRMTCLPCIIIFIFISWTDQWKLMKNHIIWDGRCGLFPCLHSIHVFWSVEQLRILDLLSLQLHNQIKLKTSETLDLVLVVKSWIVTALTTPVLIYHMHILIFEE